MVYIGRHCIVHYKYIFVNVEQVEYFVNADNLGHNMNSSMTQSQFAVVIVHVTHINDKESCRRQ